MGSPAASGPGAGPLRHVLPLAPAFRYPFQNGRLRLGSKSTNSNGQFNSHPRPSNWEAPNFLPTNGPTNPTLQAGVIGRNSGTSGSYRFEPHQGFTGPPANNGVWRPNNGWNYESHNWYSNGNNMGPRFGCAQAGNSRFPNRQSNRHQPYQAHANNYQPCNSRNEGPRPPRFQNCNNDKPWITPELKEMIRQRNVLQKRVQLLRNPKELQEFKELRQKTTNLLNTAKFDYEIKLSSQPKSERIFYCDTCDKTCFNQKGLDEHKAEHIVCKLDGCMFTAHPKVVLKHIQMQHATDLFHRIKGYKTEEEIKQWIDDRKKNFPSATNLNRKKTTASEKQARGERFPKIPVFRYPINQAQKVKDKYNKDARKRNVRGVYQGTNNSLTSGNRYDDKDYIHSKNTSPVVTLENYYALVKVGEKRQLVGKKLTLWATTYVSKTEIPDEKCGNSSDEEGRCEETNLSITDEEDEIEEGAPTIKANDMPKQGELKQQPSTSVNEETSAVSTNKKFAGLAGLLMYGSGSDGEITDSDSDNEPPDEIKIEHKQPSGRDPQKNTSMLVKGQPQPVRKSEAKVNPKQRKEQKESNLHSQPGPAISKERLNKRRQHQRAQKLRKLALKKLSSAQCSKDDEDEAEAESPEVDDMDGNIAVAEEGKWKTGHAKNSQPVAVAGSSGKGWTGNKAVKPQLKPRPRWRPPTLLERLLADDIEKEGNYLLQGCRFVVENNFFGLEDDSGGPNSKTKTKTDKKCS